MKVKPRTAHSKLPPPTLQSPVLSSSGSPFLNMQSTGLGVSQVGNVQWDRHVRGLHHRLLPWMWLNA